MGYCCVRSRSRRHVSPTLMLFMLSNTEFCTGHTCQLHGSDLTFIPLRYVLRYLSSLSQSCSNCESNR